MNTGTRFGIRAPSSPLLEPFGRKSVGHILKNVFYIEGFAKTLVIFEEKSSVLVFGDSLWLTTHSLI